MTAGQLSLTPTADAYVNSGSASQNTNFGTNVALTIKTNDATSSFARLGYMRFDLSPLGSAPLEAAELRLMVVTNNGGSADPSPTNFTVEVWGLNENVDTWTETGITWVNAPARSDNSFNSSATLLGTLNVPAAAPNYIVTFSNSTLIDFLNRDLDGSATLMIRRTDGGSPNLAFASKENTSSGSDSAPALRVTAKMQGGGVVTVLEKSDERCRYRIDYMDHLVKLNFKYALHVSDDLSNWARLDGALSTANGRLAAEVDVHSSAKELFFKLVPDTRKSLSAAELDAEQARLDEVIDDLGTYAVGLWEADPVLKSRADGEQAVRPLLVVLEQAIAELTPTERKTFLEIVYEINLVSELGSVLAVAAPPPEISARSEVSSLWPRIALARAWQTRKQKIEELTYYAGYAALLSGPSGMLAFETIDLLIKSITIMQAVTPTKLQAVRFLPDQDPTEMTLYEDSFPHLVFLGDFVADSNAVTELLNFALGKTAGKAFGMMTKIDKRSSLVQKQLRDQLYAKYQEYELNHKFGKISEGAAEAINESYSTYAQYRNIVFPADYFRFGVECDGGLPDRPPVFWNPSAERLDANMGGLGHVRFEFTDSLYRQTVNSGLPFTVTDRPPVIASAGPAQFKPETGELYIPLVITDERPDQLLVELDADHSSVTFVDGMMIYRVPSLSLIGEGERFVTSEAIESATVAAQFPYLDDEIKIRYSDHYNPEKEDFFQIDLRMLIPMIHLAIESPPAGMMQVFQVFDKSHSTGDGVAKGINMQLVQDYRGDIIDIELKAQLGTLTSLGQMTLRPGGNCQPGTLPPVITATQITCLEPQTWPYDWVTKVVDVHFESEVPIKLGGSYFGADRNNYPVRYMSQNSQGDWDWGGNSYSARLLQGDAYKGVIRITPASPFRSGYSCRKDWYYTELQRIGPYRVVLENTCGMLTSGEVFHLDYYTHVY